MGKENSDEKEKEQKKCQKRKEQMKEMMPTKNSQMTMRVDLDTNMHLLMKILQ